MLLAVHGCSWLLLAAPGCSWLLLADHGCSWLILVAPGCSWLLMAATCAKVLRALCVDNKKTKVRAKSTISVGFCVLRKMQQPYNYVVHSQQGAHEGEGAETSTAELGTGCPHFTCNRRPLCHGVGERFGGVVVLAGLQGGLVAD